MVTGTSALLSSAVVWPLGKWLVKKNSASGSSVVSYFICCCYAEIGKLCKNFCQVLLLSDSLMKL